MAEQDGAVTSASTTFGCDHVSDDDPCPARVLYERAYQSGSSDLYGWMRFHHGWHARDSDLAQARAEIEQWRIDHDKAVEDNLFLDAEWRKAKGERDAALAALQQYADQRNWFQTTHMQLDDFPTKVWAWDDSREPWSMAQNALAAFDKARHE